MQKITPALQVILDVASLVIQEERDEREARLEMETRYNVFGQALRTEQETMIAYFDRVFGERDNALQHFYDLMDEATAAGDNEQLETAVSGIVGIIRTTPSWDSKSSRRSWQTRERRSNSDPVNPRDSAGEGPLNSDRPSHWLRIWADVKVSLFRMLTGSTSLVGNLPSGRDCKSTTPPCR